MPYCSIEFLNEWGEADGVDIDIIKEVAVGNSRRISDTNIILLAISSYVINNSDFFQGIDNELYVLDTAKSGCDIGCWSGLSIEIDISNYVVEK